MIFYYAEDGWRKRACEKVEFAVELDDGTATFQEAKKFLQSVVVSAKSLVTLRNQIMFLIEDLWGSDPAVGQPGAGTIFYVWAYLPCKQGPPDADKEPIFPHSLVYVRRSLTAKDIRRVQSHMRQLAYRVHARAPTDPVPACLPFKWVRPSAGEDFVGPSEKTCQ